MARLATYLRRSTLGEEDENYSIEAQEADISERLPDFNQHVVVKRYSDPGGKSYTLARPVFQSLMRDARAGLFDMVVVGRWDRFSRVQDQQAVVIYQLEQYGVKVVSATQPVPAGPIGTLIRNNYAFAAELELYNIRDRTYGGKRRRVQNGKLPQHSVPTYGYLFANEDKSAYVIDPETAPVVTLVYDLCLSGRTIRSIVRHLNEHGIPTPSALWLRRGVLGRKRIASPEWGHSTISHMLRNRVYTGQYIAFREKADVVERKHEITGEVMAVRRMVARDEDDPERVVLGSSVVPQIISKETFEAVQDTLQRNQKLSDRNLRHPEMCLLRNGLAVCGYCGHRMSMRWSRSTNEYRYYCSNRATTRPCEGKFYDWSSKELDAAVWDWYLAVLEHPEILRVKYNLWKQTLETGKAIEQDRVESLSHLIEEAEARRLRNMDNAENEDDPGQRAEYRERAARAAHTVRDLTKEKETLEGVLQRGKQEEMLVDAIMSSGSQALENAKQFDFASRRRTLYALRVKVTCWRHDDPRKYEVGCELGKAVESALAFAGFSVQDHTWWSEVGPGRRTDRG